MKKLLFCLLLFIPMIIYAKCDNDVLTKYSDKAEQITYDVDYKNNSFIVTFYNVEDGLYLRNQDNDLYFPKNNEIIIKNLKGGTNVSYYVNTSKTNCGRTTLETFNIEIPYYNTFYDSEICEKYKGILTMCSYELLTYEVTEDIINTAIDNYENAAIVNKKEKTTQEESVIDKISELVSEWGIRIALIALSSLVTLVLFDNTYRKIKHRI